MAGTPMLEKVVEKIELFKDLDQAQLNELYTWLERRDYTAGAEIIREGRLACGMYILTGGTVSVVKTSSVRKVKLTEINAPSFFGEMGLLNNEARTAGVRAVSNVMVGYLPGKLFSNKLAENNLTALRISLNIGRTVCKRLGTTSELLANTAIIAASHP
jgi:CRP-like cAMP-binding protein